MINEYNAVVDFNDNSILNKSTNKVFDGMLNGSISVTSTNGINLTDELRDADVDKDKTSMVLVKETATGSDKELIEGITTGDISKEQLIIQNINLIK